MTWGGPPRAAGRALTVSAAAALIAGMAGPAAASAPAEPSADSVSVIVREPPGPATVPSGRSSPSAGPSSSSWHHQRLRGDRPGNRLDVLRAAAGVLEVVENASVTLTSTEVDDQVGLNGSMQRVTHEMTGAAAMWDAGYTGAGVDVAVIDSGVVPVDGLRPPARSSTVRTSRSRLWSATRRAARRARSRTLDTYGHGTHLAGIIAGRDDAAPGTVTSATSGNFVGVAPDARIVSVKVADAQGRTDVSQAIAAIDWVIQHKNANGLNIRVLNMSFGTDGVQSYQLDPLAYAAEQAWHKGIVVVVAAGNAGYGSAKLNNPAYDPYVIAVGGSDGAGHGDHGRRHRPDLVDAAATARATPTSSRRVSPWSACGCPTRSWTPPTRVRGPVSGSSAAPARRSRRRSCRALRPCSSSSGRSSRRTRSRRC